MNKLRLFFVWIYKTLARVKRRPLTYKQRIFALFLCVLVFTGSVLPYINPYLSALLDFNKIDERTGLSAKGIERRDKDRKPIVKDDLYTLADGVKDASLSEVSEKAKSEAQALQARPPKIKDREQKEKTDQRTASSRTYGLQGGGELIKTSLLPQNYSDESGSLQPIVNESSLLREGSPSLRLPSFSQAYREGLSTDRFKNDKGSLKTEFGVLGPEGIKIQHRRDTILMWPETQKSIAPHQVKKNKQSYIEYKNVWKNVDLVYQYRGVSLKEDIVINSQPETNKFIFGFDGANVRTNPENATELRLTGQLGSELAVGELNVNVNGRGIIENTVAKQYPSDDGKQLIIEVDEAWLRSQPKEAFPIVIDPTIHDMNGIPGGYYGEYTAHKSDFPNCSSSVCNVNTGNINDSGTIKTWRTVARLPYDQVVGRQLLAADLYLPMMVTPGYHGTYSNRTVYATWAHCNGFNCISGAPHSAGVVGAEGVIDITSTVQWMKDNAGTGGWLILWGEEWHGDSFKEFNPAGIELHLYTNIIPTLPTPELPAANPNIEAVVTTTEPQLKVTKSSDGNGDTVYYNFHVRTLEGGLLWSSGESPSRQAILPEGILQDGGRYKWEYEYSDVDWSSSVQNGGTFKVDLRTGKDSSQTYDEVGPLSISLNTGNVYTSASSHSISALGGDIGVKLEYNSPYLTKKGLEAQYYNNDNFQGAPSYRRIEPNINYDWDQGSPATGVIQADDFSARWNGYFVAPVAGDYYFGSNNDDFMSMTVNGSPVFSRNCCGLGWSQTPINLDAGEMAEIYVWHADYGGHAQAVLMVKGAVPEQVVPVDWLRTKPLPTDKVGGLMGHYYYDDASHAPAETEKFLVRNDPIIDFSWGDQAPLPGSPANNFYVRWEGYFTAPTTGNYKFGVGSDDGARVSVSGIERANQWSAHSYLEAYDTTGIQLSAGQTVPIVVEFFELTGAATAKLLVDGPNGKGVVSGQYLTHDSKVLPIGWNLTADADGSLAYERLNVRQNGDVMLYDSDGASQLFTTTGTGYKPPLGSDATLVKNADGSHTLTDTDGRVYVFNLDGTLQLTSLPTDDRQPAALQYEYATQNGKPKLKRIIDPVNNSRFGTLHYQGDAGCREPYGGMDAQPPAGMLCGFETTDGRYTRFMYYGGDLAVISNPGYADTSLSYDTNGTLGGFRDALTEDAVFEGQRPDDADSYTWIWYDALGRSTGMETPKPTPTAERLMHYIEFLPNASRQHVVNSADPAGYHKYIEFDDSLRTTKLCDNHAKCSTTEYHQSKDLVLSTTDALGLKQTTIYDDEDRPTDAYGPAPSAWFGADRKPLAAYVNEIPHSLTAYDENMVGPAVAYYEYKNGSNQKGKLSGRPRLHATGIQDYVHSAGENESLIQNSSVELVDPNNTQEPLHWSKNNWGSNSPQFSYVNDARTGDKSVKVEVSNYNDGDAKWFFDPLAVQPDKTYSYSHYYKSDTYTDIVAQFIDKDGNSTYQWLDWLSPATDWAQYSKSITVPASAKKLTILHVFNSNGWLQMDDAALSTVSGNAGVLQKTWASSPVDISQGYDGWGASLTGKLRLPAAGTYQIKAAHDDGVKVWIDDKLIIDDWSNGVYREATGSFSHSAGQVHRFKVEYYDVAGTGANNATLALSLKQDGGFDWTTNWSNYLKPGYGLATSGTAYDSDIGNVSTETKYLNPAYGTLKDIAVDPAGINHKSGLTYETRGEGYLRQLSKTLPGGATTQYSRWGALETADNPCTTAAESYKQAGFAKGRLDPDPDGPGSGVARTTETIYDDAGRIVANRIGDDPWTCLTYDDRGRTTSVTIPTVGARAGRVITYDYSALNGNPLASQVSDNQGSTTTLVDLLGRTVEFRDTGGNVTNIYYDHIGRASERTSKLGYEQYIYDSYSRLTAYKLENTTYATISYDEYGRAIQVEYPTIKDPVSNQTLKLNNPTRDELQRITGISYSLPDGQSISNQVELSQSGIVLDESINGVDLSPGEQGFTYDKAGRLRVAKIAGHVYQYGFDAPNSACSSIAGDHGGAGTNSNRTSYAVDGVASWYCYDRADRLLASSEAKFTTPTYDSHGNTLSLGSAGNVTSFTYDQSDRNTKIEEGANKVEYKRDHDNRVIERKVTKAGQASTYYYGSTGGSNYTFMYTNNTTKEVVEKYLVLPGGVQFTIRPTEQSTAEKTKASLRSLHGHTVAVLNGDGVNETGIMLYEPFGERTAPTSGFASTHPSIAFATSALPDNAHGDQSAAWAGAHRRSVEGLFTIAPMQMGARVYIPGLGRFLQVDPVEGGTLNNYVYVLDPINASDYSGRAAWAVALGGALAGVTAPGWLGVALVAVAVVGLVAITAILINDAVARHTPTSHEASQGSSGGGGNGGGPSTSGGAPSSGGGSPNIPKPPKSSSSKRVQKRAEQIRTKLNGSRHSVEIRTREGQTRYDLKGATHFNKVSKGGPYAGRDVTTPHKTFTPNNPRNPSDGLGNEGPAAPLNMDDIVTIIKHLTSQ